MALSTTRSSCCTFLSRLEALIRIQRFYNTVAGGGLKAQINPDLSRIFEFSSSEVAPSLLGYVDTLKWRKVNSRIFGITRSMIPPPLWTVLTILRSTGFEAYLVGGCVRDLILNKIPKDFDVITTASLQQIRKQFHRSRIVGQRFPICMVYIRGFIIEVSSFDTSQAKEKEKVGIIEIPENCDKEDFILWRNSLQRDFTINSLFFDPFLNKIYDYANAMRDLKSLKLRTLIPAQLSFEEDCARIFRGLRIAARLGFSFSKDTETAIWNLSSSVMCLAKSRIMMELNYMLSYGAAEPSLYLLQRFNLLKLLLPFHAAYLAQQFSKQTAKSSIMLMKLFSALDKLITCDRPPDCRLWVGLLAFHLALVNNPQEALVVWTFSSVLYCGMWKEGVNFAREHAQAHVNYVPEVLEACAFKSMEELAKEVTRLASLVQNSVNVLTETEDLFKSMSRYPFAPCSGLVFVPKKTGNDVAELFHVLVNGIEVYDEGRGNSQIDYNLLGRGDPSETRFVLGKIIMDTMSNRVVQMRGKMHKVAERWKSRFEQDAITEKKKMVENSHLPQEKKIKQEYVLEKKLEGATRKEEKQKMDPVSDPASPWLSCLFGEGDPKSNGVVQGRMAFVRHQKDQEVVENNCHFDHSNIGTNAMRLEEPLSAVLKQRRDSRRKLIRTTYHPELDRRPEAGGYRYLQVIGAQQQEMNDDGKCQEMVGEHQKAHNNKKLVEMLQLLDSVSESKENESKARNRLTVQKEVNEKKLMVGENDVSDKRNKKHKVVSEKGKCYIEQQYEVTDTVKVLEKFHSSQEKTSKLENVSEEKCHSLKPERALKKNEKQRTDQVPDPVRLRLSSLFS